MKMLERDPDRKAPRPLNSQLATDKLKKLGALLP